MERAFNAEAVKANMDAIVEQPSPARVAGRWSTKSTAMRPLTNIPTSWCSTHPYYPTLVELGLTLAFPFHLSEMCSLMAKPKNGVSGYVGTGPWVLTEHKDKQYARVHAK